MRSRFKFLAVLISLTLVTGVASASIKAGATCSKVGATSTSAGKKYTCIKSGKKLVWNKGVTVIKPVPTVTPTPEPSPSASPTPTPTPTPTVVPVPFEPKTLDDLILHPESNSYWAWTKSSQQISS